MLELIRITRRFRRVIPVLLGAWALSFACGASAGFTFDLHKGAAMVGAHGVHATMSSMGGKSDSCCGMKCVNLTGCAMMQSGFDCGTSQIVALAPQGLQLPAVDLARVVSLVTWQAPPGNLPRIQAGLLQTPPRPLYTVHQSFLK